MSIYGTFFSLDCEHAEECAFWVEASDGVFEPGDPADCTCDLRDAPLVYEGSHVLPSDQDRCGGEVELATIPDHIIRDDRPELPDGTLKDWLRLGVGSLDSTFRHEGKPYVAGGDATVILTRPHVERLRDALTEWLEREPSEPEDDE